MAPVTQYVFAEMLGISEHFTAGSHEWLPYSVIPTFPKLICKHQFTTAASCYSHKTGVLLWRRAPVFVSFREPYSRFFFSCTLRSFSFIFKKDCR